MHSHFLLRITQIIGYSRRNLTKNNHTKRARFNYKYAIQIITKILSKPTALIDLKLTFWVAACPNNFFLFSGTIANPSNSILGCSNSYPEYLQCPIQNNIPMATSLLYSVESYQALVLIV